MTEVIGNEQPVRVANFTQVDLPVENRLDMPADDLDGMVSTIRHHADLPFVYVVDGERAEQVAPLLSTLRAMRSPCYPYAVFTLDGVQLDVNESTLDILPLDTSDGATVQSRVAQYAQERLGADHRKLRRGNPGALPARTDVAIIGGGLIGLYAANQLEAAGIGFTILEKRPTVGGIWTAYANSASQVNTSECAYRLFEKPSRSNRDHSFCWEILDDLGQLSHKVADRLFLETEATKVQKEAQGYRVVYERGGSRSVIDCRGVILAVNDRVGEPRQIHYKNESAFRGQLVSGISDGARHVDWRDQDVVIVGMGAFAVENARTALEAGARHVTVVGRRHGTICPKIIDYLNFATPYDEEFKHDKKRNIINMMYWKKLYELSGATQPECWMGKVKHDGHTISVSDIWFVAHYLKKLETVTGEITELKPTGAIVDGGQEIAADIIVNCVGFETNSSIARSLSGHDQTFNNNYLDKDFMYLADAYIDNDAFNSLFGSSVLEMAKFYLHLYIKYFDNPAFDEMMQTPGIEKLSIEERKWSEYIKGAMSLIRANPEIGEAAKKLVAQRTANFLECHDLETYIAENKREWIDMHTSLAGRPLADDECLPYLFERLATRKA
jgi:thioredoxin reductase